MATASPAWPGVRAVDQRGVDRAVGERRQRGPDVARPGSRTPGAGTAAAASTAAVTAPQGSVSAHSATRTSGRSRSASRSTPWGCRRGTASTSWLRANRTRAADRPGRASGAGPSTASTSGAGPAAVRWASSVSAANVTLDLERRVGGLEAVLDAGERVGQGGRREEAQGAGQRRCPVAAAAPGQRQQQHRHAWPSRTDVACGHRSDHAFDDQREEPGRVFGAGGEDQGAGRHRGCGPGPG